MERVFRLKLTGTVPMLLHNGRGANPLDPYTKAVRQQSRAKTDEQISRLAYAEARCGMYETERGLLGLPIENVRAALLVAGKTQKLGRQIQAGLPLRELIIAPLVINGEEIPADRYLQDHPEWLSFVPARIRGSRVMRARAVIPTGWQATFEFTLLTDVLQLDQLDPIVFNKAGRDVGLCDWRPTHGQFSWELLS